MCFFVHTFYTIWLGLNHIEMIVFMSCTFMSVLSMSTWASVNLTIPSAINIHVSPFEVSRNVHMFIIDVDTSTAMIDFPPLCLRMSMWQCCLSDLVSGYEKQQNRQLPSPNIVGLERYLSSMLAHPMVTLILIGNYSFAAALALHYHVSSMGLNLSGVTLSLLTCMHGGTE